MSKPPRKDAGKKPAIEQCPILRSMRKLGISVDEVKLHATSLEQCVSVLLPFTVIH